MIFTFGGAMSQTFGAGGAGQPIVTLVCIAAFGSLSNTIACALGQNQIGAMIKLVTVFSCITLVISVVWNAISTLASAAGVTM
jgi:hypothetical protein